MKMIMMNELIDLHEKFNLGNRDNECYSVSDSTVTLWAMFQAEQGAATFSNR